MDSDLHKDLGPWKEVVQPINEPRSVGPHKSKPKKTRSMKKTRQNNKKLATSRDIGFIHIKAMVSSTGKRIQNGLLKIVLNYELRGFKIVSMFGDGAFELLTNWAQIELNVNLITCAPESHVPRAENAIRFVKEMARLVQSENPCN